MRCWTFCLFNLSLDSDNVYSDDISLRAQSSVIVHFWWSTDYYLQSYQLCLDFHRLCIWSQTCINPFWNNSPSLQKCLTKRVARISHPWSDFHHVNYFCKWDHLSYFISTGKGGKTGHVDQHLVSTQLIMHRWSSSSPYEQFLSLSLVSIITNFTEELKSCLLIGAYKVLSWIDMYKLHNCVCQLASNKVHTSVHTEK